MSRSMSLTLLLMAGSMAAAVAAPELGLRSDPDECLEMRAVAGSAWSAAPFNARQARLPVAVGATAGFAISPCATDVTEPYRMLHHGSAKLVPGCGAMSST